MRITEKQITTPLQSIQRRTNLRRYCERLFLAFCVFPYVYLFSLINLEHISVILIWSILSISVFLIVGVVIGWYCKIGGLTSAARIADKHYGLSDRMLTAVSLLQKKQNLTAMERLQIEDAAEYAKQIIPSNTALPSIDYKRFMNYALIYLTILLLVSFAGLYVPRFYVNSGTFKRTAPVETSLTSVPIDDTLVSKLRKYSAQYNKDAKSNADKPANENKLSRGSEMNEAIRKKLRYWDTAAKIASMNDIADALDVAAATRKAAEALKDKRYSDAANELNQMNSDLISTMSNKERREVADMLQKAIQKTKDRGQTPLAESIEKVETALKMGQAEGFDELAAESKQLAMQQMAQSQEQAKTLSYMQGSGSGGKDTEKSNQEGKNYGTGEAGDPTGGQATELDSKKERQELSGIIGEGESEFEKAKEVSPKKTEREYNELQYVIKKVPEDVLNKEPLPLEQRQTLRRYFDLLQQEQK